MEFRCIDGLCCKWSWQVNVEPVQVKSTYEFWKGGFNHFSLQVGTSVDVDDALQLGNCKGAQGLSESELEIALGARNGRSVVSVCEDTSFEVISQLQDSLQSKSMPYLVAYTGQSDKVGALSPSYCFDKWIQQNWGYLGQLLLLAYETDCNILGCL